LAKRDAFVSKWNKFVLKASSLIANSWQIVAVIYIFMTISIVSRTQKRAVF